MITITIKTDNAAFDDGDNGRTEVARILRGLADKCEGEKAQTCLPAGVYDANGNKVGDVRLTGKDRAI